MGLSRAFVSALSLFFVSSQIYHSSQTLSSHKHASYSACRIPLFLIWPILTCLLVSPVAQPITVWSWLQGYWICFQEFLFCAFCMKRSTPQFALGFVSWSGPLRSYQLPVLQLVSVCFIV